jgi:hypothetical protein
MGSRVAASTGAGVIAGIVFGAMMHMMTAPTPDGGQMPVIAMVGRIVGSPTVTAGWVYHLFNSAVIGAIFGWLLGARVQGYGSALGWGDLSRKTPRNLAIWRLDTESWHAGSVP